MISKKLSLLFVGLLSVTGYLSADFIGNTVSNAGTFQGAKQTVIAHESFINNGTISCSESAYIEAGTLAGRGLIKAPHITIFAKNFNYTGTIQCFGRGVITTQKPVNRSKFKVVGKGKIEFHVDPALELPSEKPVNDLPVWWKQTMADFKNHLTPTSSVYKVSIHITADAAAKKSKIYGDFKNAVSDIMWFMQTGARFVEKPAQELNKRLQALAWRSIQIDTQGVHCCIDRKDIKVSDFFDALDRDAHASHITFAIFILYDATQSKLANISFDQHMPLEEVIKTFFDPAIVYAYQGIQDFVYRINSVN